MGRLDIDVKGENFYAQLQLLTILRDLPHTSISWTILPQQSLRVPWVDPWDKITFMQMT